MPVLENSMATHAFRTENEFFSQLRYFYLLPGWPSCCVLMFPSCPAVVTAVLYCT